MSMTIKQLREALEGKDDDMLVVLSSDGEGNSHSPLAEAADAQYVAECTWSGYLVDDEDGEVDEDAVPVLVLWPVN